MNKHIYFIAAFFLFTIFSFSQTNERKVCGTTKIMQEALQDPEKKQILDQLEIFTQEFVANIENNRMSGPYIIPVVVHVIHDYGTENISYEQIDNGIFRINEDFQGQNDDLSQVIDSFTNVIGFPDIEFRLATKDPDGNPTYGVTRTASVWTDNGGPSTVRPLVNWDNKKYVNIYVVRSFTESMSGAAAYATKPGSGGSEYGDYIFCTYTYFGDWNPNTDNGPTGSNWSRHTMPHEMGHFFNLDHPWGGSNDPGDEDTNCAMDDGVADTPPTAGVGDASCDVEQRTCDGSLDNVQNIMDYSNCALMFTQGQSDRMIAAANSFAGNRYYLWQPENLVNTGTDDDHWYGPDGIADTSDDSERYTGMSPIPDFKSDTDLGCIGSDISFENFTYNYRTENVTYNWTFDFGEDENGDPIEVLSDDPNPIIQYTSPGTYDVTLESCNGNFCQTLTRTNYITILSVTDVDADQAVTSLQSFEDESFPNVNLETPETDDDEIWWIGNDHGEKHWERSSVSGSDLAASFRIQSKNYGYERRSHEFSTPALNLSDFSTSNSDPLWICFDYAYARRLPYNKVNYDPGTGTVDGDPEGFSIHNDALIVSYKNSCDGNWIERPRLSTRPGEDGSFQNQQKSLITTDKIYFNDFTPADYEWDQYCISIQAVAGSSEVVLKFEFVGTGETENQTHWVNADGFLQEITSSSIGGNWLYIDNIILGNRSEIEARNCAPYESWEESSTSNPNQYSWCEWCVDYNNEFEYWTDFNPAGISWSNPNVACDCCPPPTWDCTTDGCEFLNSGEGEYSSLEACEAACVTTWDCTINGCQEVLSTGEYSSLEDCELVCDSESSRVNSIIRDLSINPNPSKINQSTFSFDMAETGDVNIFLTNLYGKKLGAKTLNLTEGTHRYMVSELFSISSKGAYIINVQEGNSQLSEIIMIR